MEYKVLFSYGDTLEEAIELLEIQVKKYCHDGWIPQGGVSFHENSYGYKPFSLFKMTQAMVRKPKTPRNEKSDTSN